MQLLHFDQSITYFKEALTIDSTFINSYVNYGYLLNNNKQYESAIELFRKGLNYVKSSEEKGYLEFNIATSYYRLKKCSKAIEMADSAILHLNSNEMTSKLSMFKNEVENNCKN